MPAKDVEKVSSILSKKKVYTKSDVIPVLQEVQDVFGYLPKDVLSVVAQKLRMELSEVMAVATFFNQFRLKPVGKHLLQVCHGTACHVGGAENVDETINAELKFKPGSDTTVDGDVTIKKVACLGCCSLAPCVMADGKVYGRLSNGDKVRKMLKEAVGNKKDE
ncbi:MAG: NAD(P)H-dependent oxidoreductase subunit E [Elusimicrobiota bacterium]